MMFFDAVKVQWPNKRIILDCMGDSLTDRDWATTPINLATWNANLPPSRSHWSSLVEGQLRIGLINAGIAGQNTEDMVGVREPEGTSRFDTDIVAKYPTHCIIMGGANDCFQNYTYTIKGVTSYLGPTHMENNIKLMVQKCLDADIVPIVMNCPVSAYSGFETPVPTQAANIQHLHDFCVAYTAANNIAFIDLYQTALRSNGVQDPACYLSDLVHLSSKGSMVIAQVVVNKLIEFIPA